VMNSALDLVTPQIDERRMRVIRKLPTSLPPVECDPDLIRIVLVNLLSNAAKYGRPGGEITIETGILKNGLYIRVRNEGPGFAPEQRGRLFRKFSRLQSPELRKERGTGVGLYTSWNIVYLHGGRIDAESEPGAWAEFRFTIPQPPLRPDTAHSAPQAPDATAGPATVSPRARSRRQSPGAG